MLWYFLEWSIPVIAENNRHAHHETHLHTTKVVTILIPSFHGLGWKRMADKLGPTDREKKKEKKETPAFLESCSAKESSTNQCCTIYIHYANNYYHKRVSIVEMPTSGDLKKGDSLFFHTHPPPPNFNGLPLTIRFISEAICSSVQCQK